MYSGPTQPTTTVLPNSDRPYDERSTPRTRVIRYGESLGWIAATLLLAYFIDLRSALQNYGYGIPFYLLFLSMSGWILVFFYLQFYVPIRTGTRPDLKHWETQARQPVQIATAFAVVSGVSSIWMLWPAYGWFTPLVVFLFFMGTVSFIGLF
ncbi:hypothetical protein BC832DRAFT_19415 [Gaertneriomyces semiglobifer]|nr:hypothetical protein BC832DRAFT_19415 [Gaertneriomyces semiglobifer]